MHIYIAPVVFEIIAIYLAIGIILYVPIMYWSYRFVSPKGSTWSTASFRSIFLGIMASSISWPLMVLHCVKMERKYGILK